MSEYATINVHASTKRLANKNIEKIEKMRGKLGKDLGEILPGLEMEEMKENLVSGDDMTGEIYSENGMGQRTYNDRNIGSGNFRSEDRIDLHVPVSDEEAENVGNKLEGTMKKYYRNVEVNTYQGN